MTMFEQKLNDWLIDNSFTCKVKFDTDFAYETKENVLYVGINGYSTVGRWFEQFLYEYGLDYTGIYDPVLCLCHELGHSMTINQFSDEELRLFQFAKFMTEDERMESADGMFKYWEIKDEFAANMWAIQFINTNIDCVCELCEIYRLYWNDFIKERKCA